MQMAKGSVDRELRCLLRLFYRLSEWIVDCVSAEPSALYWRLTCHQYFIWEDGKLNVSIENLHITKKSKQVKIPKEYFAYFKILL
ncbi:hypothetical protein SK128_023780 [Halocaridina rubra]|uniref:Uncharacterized protein n=1 Tax=Halocaridina rubra TaxID=373956 RepID=A0AAN9A1S1_HALRR